MIIKLWTVPKHPVWQLECGTAWCASLPWGGGYFINFFFLLIISSVLKSFKNTTFLLDTTFTFDRCHCSSAAVTPVRYECNPTDLTDTFANQKWSYWCTHAEYPHLELGLQKHGEACVCTAFDFSLQWRSKSAYCRCLSLYIKGEPSMAAVMLPWWLNRHLGLIELPSNWRPW